MTTPDRAAFEAALDELIQAAYSCGRASILQDPGPRFDEMGDKVLAARAAVVALVPDSARVEALGAVAAASRNVLSVAQWGVEEWRAVDALRTALAALDMDGEPEDAGAGGAA